MAQNNLDKRIDIHEIIGPREGFINEIRNQCNVRILYSDFIQPKEIDTIAAGSYTVRQVLDSLLKDFDVRYISKGNQIIISPRPPRQQLDKKFPVEGSIVNKREKAVPFATVYLKGSSLGTISNSEGRFRLLIKESNITDTLVVSSLGYEPVKIPPELYLAENLEIELRSAYIPIKDIIVRPSDPNQLVAQSFAAREKNYSIQPQLLTVYFREASKQDEEYISISEALIEVNKSSYTSNSEDLVKLIKGRNGTNTVASELVNLTVKGGLYNGIRLDVAKYILDFYQAEATWACKYRMLRTTYLNQRQTYVIGFEMVHSPIYLTYKGKLYIDAESLALARAEFELTSSGIQYARNVLIKKTPRNYKAVPKYAKYEVEYRRYNGIWNLHYARGELGIKVKKVRGKENRGFSCDFTSTVEFVVTDHPKIPRTRFRLRESSGPHDILVQQVKDTESAFWIDDNIIKPEEPLLSTIKKLQQEGVIPQKDSVMTKDQNMP